MAHIELRLEKRETGEIAWLTVHRPEKLNALSPELAPELAAKARSLHQHDGLRAVVVTGAGARAFIGGADIVAMSGFDVESARRFITSLHHAIEAIRRIPVPTIARINGFCLGAGLEVAAGCDLRLASVNAMFGMPEVKVGMPSVIEAALLPRLIGMGQAARLVLLGESLDAAEALRIGLVERVVAEDRLDAVLEEWLSHLLESGPEALRLQKKLLDDWQNLPLAQAIDAGIACFAAAYESGEPQRMTAEFLARRKRR